MGLEIKPLTPTALAVVKGSYMQLLESPYTDAYYNAAHIGSLRRASPRQNYTAYDKDGEKIGEVSSFFTSVTVPATGDVLVVTLWHDEETGYEFARYPVLAWRIEDNKYATPIVTDPNLLSSPYFLEYRGNGVPYGWTNQDGCYWSNEEEFKTAAIDLYNYWQRAEAQRQEKARQAYIAKQSAAALRESEAANG